jgi:chemotaxis response regulator CheB
MTRVLMGDFDALLRLGFREIFNDAHVELIETDGDEVLSRLVETLPDVVVLDMDKTDTPVIVERIVEGYPAIVVISCSSAAPTMRVFPPFHRGESYVAELDLTQFTHAIQA